VRRLAAAFPSFAIPFYDGKVWVNGQAEDVRKAAAGLPHSKKEKAPTGAGADFSTTLIILEP
jgi:hypothetical protein